MRILCSTCNNTTNHEVVKEFIKEYTPENTPEMNIDYAKGNALHELDIPSNEELKLAIEIIEHTLDNIYELQDKVEELRLQKKRREKKL